MLRNWAVCQTLKFINKRCVNWLRVSTSLKVCIVSDIQAWKMRKQDFLFGFCSQFITGFVIRISFFLSGSNDFTCPLAFLYLIRTDCVPRFIQFLSCICQNKLNPWNCGGKQKEQKAVMEGRGDRVNTWTNSPRMNLLPGGSSPSPGQLPAGGGADVWYQAWRVCVFAFREGLSMWVCECRSREVKKRGVEAERWWS